MLFSECRSRSQTGTEQSLADYVTTIEIVYCFRVFVDCGFHCGKFRRTSSLYASFLNAREIESMAKARYRFPVFAFTDARRETRTINKARKKAKKS